MAHGAKPPDGFISSYLERAKSADYIITLDEDELAPMLPL
jgi:hypothetical protein